MGTTPGLLKYSSVTTGNCVLYHSYSSNTISGPRSYTLAKEFLWLWTKRELWARLTDSARTTYGDILRASASLPPCEAAVETYRQMPAFPRVPDVIRNAARRWDRATRPCAQDKTRKRFPPER